MNLNGKTKITLGIAIWVGLVATIVGFNLVPLQSNKTVDLPFFQSDKNQALVFFGFPSCESVCPMTMTHISQMIKQIPNEADRPEVLFINIKLDDSNGSSQQYANYFGKNFIGYQPSEKELNHLTSEFGLNIQRQGSNISHKGRTYLLNRHDDRWVLVKSFNPSEYSLELLNRDLVRS